ncbi:hypothetical protein PDIDSM_8218 [Penicillium digitatum]|nr:hypothetical protein PDIDSM_8218 [Penicillium digitatum]
MDPVQGLGLEHHGAIGCHGSSRLHWPMRLGPKYVREARLRASNPCIILAPVLVSFLFLIVPQEARTLRLCWVPPRFITPIFVGCDIIALLLHFGGAVMISAVDAKDKDAKSKLTTGKHVAQVGVIIQLVAFGLFAVAAVRFNFTSKRFSGSLSERYENVGEKKCIVGGIVKDKNWPALLRVVNLTTILILVRSIYRLIEFTEGTKGYLSTNEWPLYVFDALCIYPCVALFVYWHPGRYLPYLGFRLPKGSQSSRDSEIQMP